MTPEKKQAKKKAPVIDIFRAWCKGCGICVAFCPKKALARDEAGIPYVKDPEACAGCGLCELRCPDFAITIEKEGDRPAEDEREKAQP